MNVMQGRKQNQDESIHLFITRGVGIRKNFTLIQGLSHFYKTHPQSNLSKKKNLSWHTLIYFFNIDEPQLIQVFLYLFIIKKLPYLGL